MGRPLDEDCFADGLGGSLTFHEGGGLDVGFDFLGNQFANASFDSESGEWGNPQFNSSWASDVTQMMQQDFADNEQQSRNQKEKTAAALAGLSVDSSEKYRREFDAAERRLGENFDSDKFNGEFFSSNPAIDEARKNRYLEMLRSKDPNAGSNFTSFEREYREGLSEDNTPFTWDGMISAFESHEYNQDLMKKLYGPAERNGKTETAETSILDRFSAGVATVLSALGISAVGLGLLNRTGGAGSAAGTAGGSEPGVPTSETVQRRREDDVDGGTGGTDGAYYNDDPLKGLTTDELFEKNALQEKYESGNASEEEMNRLSFLSTIDNIARYGDSVAESSGNLPVRDLRLEITKIRLGEDAGKTSFPLIPEYLQGFQETLTAEKKIQLLADPELKKLLEVMPDLSKDGLNDIIMRASVKSETVLSYLVKNYGSEFGSIESMRKELILHFIEEISKRNFEMNWMLAERNLPENKKLPVSASKTGDTLLSGQTVNPMTGMFGGTINVSDTFTSLKRPKHYAMDVINIETVHNVFDGKVIETGTGSTAVIDGVVRGIWEENGKVYYLDNNSQQTELLSPIDRSGGLSVLGNYIKVQSSQYGFSFTTTYAHLEKPYTGEKNSTIFMPIGKAGLTGQTTGKHLHLVIQLDTIPSDIDRTKVRTGGGKIFVDPVYFMNYYLPMRQKVYTNLNDYINSRGRQ